MIAPSNTPNVFLTATKHLDHMVDVFVMDIQTVVMQISTSLNVNSEGTKLVEDMEEALQSARLKLSIFEIVNLKRILQIVKETQMVAKALVELFTSVQHLIANV